MTPNDPQRPRSSVGRKRLSRLLAIVATLPEATTAPAGQQHLSIEVRGKRFAYWLDDHHGDGRVALHCKAAAGVNRTLVQAHPDRFFIPPYVGVHGWVGLWLDLRAVDWDEIERLLVDGYRLTAPKRLVAAVRAPPER